jgi:hypothetical protein
MNKIKKYSIASLGAIVVLFTFGFSGIMNANASGPIAINLGTAANFVILSETGIAAGAGTTITGDIGVSPIAATAITGFGLIMDPSNEFSTSSLVTGKVYASDYTVPTPALMTTAVGDMQTAYTNAAGQPTTSASTTNVGGGVLTGLTLTPGVYTWGTAVTIPTDLTLDAQGDTNAVWIFQISGTLDISSSKQVILIGGAQANNIFWQVSGQTTLNTTSVFNGNILDQTGIVLNTGAVLNGRALAQSAVTLQANSVTTPASITPLTLSSVAITTPATKLSYTVGDILDISGMVLTGTYSDSSTSTIVVVPSNVAGFDSSVAVMGQTVAVTINGKTTTFLVNVLNPIVAPVFDSIAITTPATKLSYIVGDTLDITGMVVTGTYSDSSTSTIVATSSNVTGFNSSVPAVSQTLTVTLSGKTTTYTISIAAAPITLTSIAITTPATKLSYIVGDTLDIYGLVVTGTFSDSSTSTLTIALNNVTGFDSSTSTTNQVLTITRNGKTTTYMIDVLSGQGTITGTVSGGIVPGALAITSITPVNTNAIADGTFASGWKYIFNITVPDTESHLSMRFGNWISTISGSTILVANNMRISSAQADNSGAKIILTVADIFLTTSLNMVSDLSTTSLGKQVQVLVETSIPLNSVNGVYNTNFGVQTLP